MYPGEGSSPLTSFLPALVDVRQGLERLWTWLIKIQLELSNMLLQGRPGEEKC